MEWAEVGKTAVFFHNGGASETCIGTYWYQAYAGGEWWSMSHGEPFLLRSFAGKPEKLAAAVDEMLAGKEVVVPCMVDGNKDDLHKQRGEDPAAEGEPEAPGLQPQARLRRLGRRGLPPLAGHARLHAITPASPASTPRPRRSSRRRLRRRRQARPLPVGAGKVALLQNGGESLERDAACPVRGGCRAAVWADYNGDGKPDLLLATPTGPKLFTNLGDGTFRDDTHAAAEGAGYNLTAAAWIDHDGDGKPDILLANGFHGLRLYRNNGDTVRRAVPKAKPVQPTAALGSKTSPTRSAWVRTASARARRATP